MKQINKVKKLTAIFTATFFIITQVGMANPARAQATVVSEVKIESPSFNLFLPPDLGTIQTLVSGQGPVLVHIQTAHGNYEAQKKIQSILHYLKDRYGFDLLLIEGGANPLKPELISIFPERKDLNADILDALTRDALVKGEELFLSEENGVKAFGVENLEAYRANGEAFRAVLTEKERSESFLQDMDMQIERSISPYLNKNLKDFLKDLEHFEGKVLPIESWLSLLKKKAAEILELDLVDPVNQLDWPMLSRFYALHELEATMNPNALAAEKREFLKAIGTISKDTYAEIEKLISEPLSQHQLPDPGTGLLFERMVSELPAAFDFNAYPNVRLVVTHLILQSEIKGGRLLSEMDRLAEKISGRLSATNEEKEILKLLKDYWLLKRLFSLELTPDDYKKLSDRGEDIQPSKIIERFLNLNGDHRVKAVEFSHVKEIEVLFGKAFEFYRWVKERDDFMIHNVMSRMTEAGVKKAIVITGGFHAGPFQDYFSDHGYNYALVAPKITTIGGREAYVQSILDYQIQPSDQITSTYQSVPYLAYADEDLLAHGINPDAVKLRVLNAAMLQLMKRGQRDFGNQLGDSRLRDVKITTVNSPDGKAGFDLTFPNGHRYWAPSQSVRIEQVVTGNVLDYKNVRGLGNLPLVAGTADTKRSEARPEDEQKPESPSRALAIRQELEAVHIDLPEEEIEKVSEASGDRPAHEVGALVVIAKEHNIAPVDLVKAAESGQLPVPVVKDAAVVTDRFGGKFDVEKVVDTMGALANANRGFTEAESKEKDVLQTAADEEKEELVDDASAILAILNLAQERAKGGERLTLDDVVELYKLLHKDPDLTGLVMGILVKVADPLRKKSKVIKGTRDEDGMVLTKGILEDALAGLKSLQGRTVNLAEYVADMYDIDDWESLNLLDDDESGYVRSEVRSLEEVVTAFDKKKLEHRHQAARELVKANGIDQLWIPDLIAQAKQESDIAKRLRAAVLALSILRASLASKKNRESGLRYINEMIPVVDELMGGVEKQQLLVAYSGAELVKRREIIASTLDLSLELMGIYQKVMNVYLESDDAAYQRVVEQMTPFTSRLEELEAVAYKTAKGLEGEVKGFYDEVAAALRAVQAYRSETRALALRQELESAKIDLPDDEIEEVAQASGQRPVHEVGALVVIAKEHNIAPVDLVKAAEAGQLPVPVVKDAAVVTERFAGKEIKVEDVVDTMGALANANRGFSETPSEKHDALQTAADEEKEELVDDAAAIIAILTVAREQAKAGERLTQADIMALYELLHKDADLTGLVMGILVKVADPERKKSPVIKGTYDDDDLPLTRGILEETIAELQTLQGRSVDFAEHIADKYHVRNWTDLNILDNPESGYVRSEIRIPNGPEDVIASFDKDRFDERLATAKQWLAYIHVNVATMDKIFMPEMLASVEQGTDMAARLKTAVIMLSLIRQAQIPQPKLREPRPSREEGIRRLGQMIGAIQTLLNELESQHLLKAATDKELTDRQAIMLSALDLSYEIVSLYREYMNEYLANQDTGAEGALTLLAPLMSSLTELEGSVYETAKVYEKTAPKFYTQVAEAMRQIDEKRSETRQEGEGQKPEESKSRALAIREELASIQINLPEAEVEKVAEVSGDRPVHEVGALIVIAQEHKIVPVDLVKAAETGKLPVPVAEDAATVTERFSGKGINVEQVVNTMGALAEVNRGFSSEHVAEAEVLKSEADEVKDELVDDATAILAILTFAQEHAKGGERLTMEDVLQLYRSLYKDADIVGLVMGILVQVSNQKKMPPIKGISEAQQGLIEQTLVALKAIEGQMIDPTDYVADMFEVESLDGLNILDNPESGYFRSEARQTGPSEEEVTQRALAIRAQLDMRAIPMEPREREKVVEIGAQGNQPVEAITALVVVANKHGNITPSRLVKLAVDGGLGAGVAEDALVISERITKSTGARVIPEEVVNTMNTLALLDRGQQTTQDDPAKEALRNTVPDEEKEILVDDAAALLAILRIARERGKNSGSLLKEDLYRLYDLAWRDRDELGLIMGILIKVSHRKKEKATIRDVVLSAIRRLEKTQDSTREPSKRISKMYGVRDLEGLNILDDPESGYVRSEVRLVEEVINAFGKKRFDDRQSVARQLVRESGIDGLPLKQLFEIAAKDGNILTRINAAIVAIAISRAALSDLSSRESGAANLIFGSVVSENIFEYLLQQKLLQVAEPSKISKQYDTIIGGLELVFEVTAAYTALMNIYLSGKNRTIEQSMELMAKAFEQAESIEESAYQSAKKWERQNKGFYDEVARIRRQIEAKRSETRTKIPDGYLITIAPDGYTEEQRQLTWMAISRLDKNYHFYIGDIDAAKFSAEAQQPGEVNKALAAVMTNNGERPLEWTEARIVEGLNELLDRKGVMDLIEADLTTRGLVDSRVQTTIDIYRGKKRLKGFAYDTARRLLLSMLYPEGVVRKAIHEARVSQVIGSETAVLDPQQKMRGVGITFYRVDLLNETIHQIANERKVPMSFPGYVIAFFDSKNKSLYLDSSAWASIMAMDERHKQLFEKHILLRARHPELSGAEAEAIAPIKPLLEILRKGELRSFTAPASATLGMNIRRQPPKRGKKTPAPQILPNVWLRQRFNLMANEDIDAFIETWDLPKKSNQASGIRAILEILDAYFGPQIGVERTRGDYCRYIVNLGTNLDAPIRFDGSELTIDSSLLALPPRQLQALMLYSLDHMSRAEKVADPNPEIRDQVAYFDWARDYIMRPATYVVQERTKDPGFEIKNLESREAEEYDYLVKAMQSLGELGWDAAAQILFLNELRIASREHTEIKRVVEKQTPMAIVPKSLWYRRIDSWVRKSGSRASALGVFDAASFEKKHGLKLTKGKKKTAPSAKAQDLKEAPGMPIVAEPSELMTRELNLRTAIKSSLASDAIARLVPGARADLADALSRRYFYSPMVEEIMMLQTRMGISYEQAYDLLVANRDFLLAGRMAGWKMARRFFVYHTYDEILRDLRSSTRDATSPIVFGITKRGRTEAPMSYFAAVDMFYLLQVMLGLDTVREVFSGRAGNLPLIEEEKRFLLAFFYESLRANPLDLKTYENVVQVPMLAENLRELPLKVLSFADALQDQGLNSDVPYLMAGESPEIVAEFIKRLAGLSFDSKFLKQQGLREDSVLQARQVLVAKLIERWGLTIGLSLRLYKDRDKNPFDALLIDFSNQFKAMIEREEAQALERGDRTLEAILLLRERMNLPASDSFNSAVLNLLENAMPALLKSDLYSPSEAMAVERAAFRYLTKIKHEGAIVMISRKTASFVLSQGTRILAATDDYAQATLAQGEVSAAGTVGKHLLQYWVSATDEMQRVGRIARFMASVSQRPEAERQQIVQQMVQDPEDLRLLLTRVQDPRLKAFILQHLTEEQRKHLNTMQTDEQRALLSGVEQADRDVYQDVTDDLERKREVRERDAYEAFINGLPDVIETYRVNADFPSGKVPNYYKILGVSRDANEATVNASYRRLAIIWHPDRFQKEIQQLPREQADARMKELHARMSQLAEAYAVLSNKAAKKLAYVSILPNKAHLYPRAGTSWVQEYQRLQRRQQEGRSEARTDVELEGGRVRKVAEVNYVAAKAARADAETPVEVQTTNGAEGAVNFKPWTIYALELEGSVAQSLIGFAKAEAERFAKVRESWKQKPEDERKAVAKGWKDLTDTQWQGPPRILMVPEEEMKLLGPALYTNADGFIFGDNSFAIVGEETRLVDEKGLLAKAAQDKYVRVSTASLVTITVTVAGKKYYLLQGSEKQLQKKGAARYQPFGGHAYFTQKFLTEKMAYFGIIPEKKNAPHEMAFYIKRDKLDEFLALYNAERSSGQWEYFVNPAEVIRAELMEEIAGQNLDGTQAEDGLAIVHPVAFQIRRSEMRIGTFTVADKNVTIMVNAPEDAEFRKVAENAYVLQRNNVELPLRLMIRQGVPYMAIGNATYRVFKDYEGKYVADLRTLNPLGNELWFKFFGITPQEARGNYSFSLPTDDVAWNESLRLFPVNSTLYPSFVPKRLTKEEVAEKRAFLYQALVKERDSAWFKKYFFDILHHLVLVALNGTPQDYYDAQLVLNRLIDSKKFPLENALLVQISDYLLFSYVGVGWEKWGAIKAQMTARKAEPVEKPKRASSVFERMPEQVRLNVSEAELPDWEVITVQALGADSTEVSEMATAENDTDDANSVYKIGQRAIEEAKVASLVFAGGSATTVKKTVGRNKMVHPALLIKTNHEGAPQEWISILDARLGLIDGQNPESNIDIVSSVGGTREGESDRDVLEGMEGYLGTKVQAGLVEVNKQRAGLVLDSNTGEPLRFKDGHVATVAENHLWAFLSLILNQQRVVKHIAETEGIVIAGNGDNILNYPRPGMVGAILKAREQGEAVATVAVTTLSAGDKKGGFAAKVTYRNKRTGEVREQVEMREVSEFFTDAAKGFSGIGIKREDNQELYDEAKRKGQFIEDIFGEKQVAFNTAFYGIDLKLIIARIFGLDERMDGKKLATELAKIDAQTWVDRILELVANVPATVQPAKKVPTEDGTETVQGYMTEQAVQDFIVNALALLASKHGRPSAKTMIVTAKREDLFLPYKGTSQDILDENGNVLEQYTQGKNAADFYDLIANQRLYQGAVARLLQSGHRMMLGPDQWVAATERVTLKQVQDINRQQRRPTRIPYWIPTPIQITDQARRNADILQLNIGTIANQVKKDDSDLYLGYTNFGVTLVAGRPFESKEKGVVQAVEGQLKTLTHGKLKLTTKTAHMTVGAVVRSQKTPITEEDLSKQNFDVLLDALRNVKVPMKLIFTGVFLDQNGDVVLRGKIPGQEMQQLQQKLEAAGFPLKYKAPDIYIRIARITPAVLNALTQEEAQALKTWLSQPFEPVEVEFSGPLRLVTYSHRLLERTVAEDLKLPLGQASEFKTGADLKARILKGFQSVARSEVRSKLAELFNRPEDTKIGGKKRARTMGHLVAKLAPFMVNGNSLMAAMMGSELGKRDAFIYRELSIRGLDAIIDAVTTLKEAVPANTNIADLSGEGVIRLLYRLGVIGANDRSNVPFIVPEKKPPQDQSQRSEVRMPSEGGNITIREVLDQFSSASTPVKLLQSEMTQTLQDLTQSFDSNPLLKGFTWTVSNFAVDRSKAQTSWGITVNDGAGKVMLHWDIKVIGDVSDKARLQILTNASEIPVLEGDLKRTYFYAFRGLTDAVINLVTLRELDRKLQETVQREMSDEEWRIARRVMRDNLQTQQIKDIEATVAETADLILRSSNFLASVPSLVIERTGQRTPVPADTIRWQIVKDLQKIAELQQGKPIVLNYFEVDEWLGNVKHRMPVYRNPLLEGVTWNIHVDEVSAKVQTAITLVVKDRSGQNIQQFDVKVEGRDFQSAKITITMGLTDLNAKTLIENMDLVSFYGVELGITKGILTTVSEQGRQKIAQELEQKVLGKFSRPATQSDQAIVERLFDSAVQNGWQNVTLEGIMQRALTEIEQNQKKEEDLIQSTIEALLRSKEGSAERRQAVSELVRRGDRALTALQKTIESNPRAAKLLNPVITVIQATRSESRTPVADHLDVATLVTREITPVVEKTFRNIRAQRLPIRFEKLGSEFLIAALEKLLGRKVYSEMAGILPETPADILAQNLGEGRVTATPEFGNWMKRTTPEQGQVLLDQNWMERLIKKSPRALFILLSAFDRYQQEKNIHKPLVAVVGTRETLKKIKAALEQRDNQLTIDEKIDAQKFLKEARLNELIQVVDEKSVPEFIQTNDYGVAMLLANSQETADTGIAANFILNPDEISRKDLLAIAFLVPALLKAAQLIRGLKNPVEQMKLLEQHMDDIVPGASRAGEGFTIQLAQYIQKVLISERLIDVAA